MGHDRRPLTAPVGVCPASPRPAPCDFQLLGASYGASGQHQVGGEGAADAREGLEESPKSRTGMSGTCSYDPPDTPRRATDGGTNRPSPETAHSSARKKSHCQRLTSLSSGVARQATRRPAPKLALHSGRTSTRSAMMPQFVVCPAQRRHHMWHGDKLESAICATT